MVELFAARDLPGTPRQIGPGRSVSPRASSPRRPRLNEPLLWPEPPGVDSHHLRTITTSPSCTAGHVRVAPLSGRIHASGRTPGLIPGTASAAEKSRVLIRRAPVEPEEPLSWRIQLYGRGTRRVVSPAHPWPGWLPGLAGVPPRPSHCRAHVVRRSRTTRGLPAPRTHYTMREGSTTRSRQNPARFFPQGPRRLTRVQRSLALERTRQARPGSY